MELIASLVDIVLHVDVHLAAFVLAYGGWVYALLASHQWLLACWQQRGLAVVPNTNLVSNIGFGPSATHTSSVGIGGNLPQL